MFGLPTEEQIRDVGRGLGLHLTPGDLELFGELITEQLADADDFLNERLDEGMPEVLYPRRAPGWRPTVEEDPYNAWIWRSEIAGSDDGLLKGKTVSVKDHIAVAGLPISWGSRVFDGLVAPYDATVVSRALAAGATVIGKNTHHGFSGLKSMGGGLGDYWSAINPRSPELQTGGSSSGPAAAVAAGEVDIAYGGDQGGSIRHPAAYCGVVGLKPTYGLVSHAGAFYGGEPTIDHIGPMARTVQDVALGLEAVAGYDGQDSRQGRDVPDGVDVVRHVDTGVRGTRVGILREGFDDEHGTEISKSIRAAVEALERAGAEVSEVSIPEHISVLRPASLLQLSGMRAVRNGGPFILGRDAFVPTSFVAAVNRAWADHADEMGAFLRLTWLCGEFTHQRFSGAVLAKAHNVRRHFVRAYDSALRDVDVLVMPTCPVPTPRVSAPQGHDAARRRELDVLAEVFPTYRNLQPFNYTGHPAIAVPCGEVVEGIASMQIVGRPFGEADLLRVAKVVEDTAV